MGNVFSCCIMSGEDDEVPLPDVPDLVREVFSKHSSKNDVITSKGALKFFQQYQNDKAVLQGPIAAHLLNFPSTSGLDSESDPNPLNPLGSGAAEHPPGSVPGGGERGGLGAKLRAFSMAPRKAALFSLTMEKGAGDRMGTKSSFLTVGAKENVVPVEPNIDKFFKLLLNPLATPAMEDKVNQDMTEPVSHYYIFTGHNSYLTGNQLTSESSVAPIIDALERGVRVIELDIWPNDKKTEILVMHGGTLTKPVSFTDCIKAIKEHAFTASEYPVVITLEDHLPANLQAKAGEILSAVLGDTLWFPSEELQHASEFPSPHSLRHRVVISTQPPKSQKELAAVAAELSKAMEESSAAELDAGAGAAGATPDGGSVRDRAGVEEAAGEEELVNEDDSGSSSGQDKVLEYGRLITIPGGRLKGATVQMSLRETPTVKRISLSETQLASAAKTLPQDLVRFTQRNLLRIYPFGLRVMSSNYNPMLAWLHGAQMVAVNMQGYGRPLWLVHGFFKANGGCGYVKKPQFYTQPPSAVDAGGEVADAEEGLFNPHVLRPVQTVLKMRILVGTGWLERFGKTHFDAYTAPDFFARVSIEGVPADTQEIKLASQPNQWNPSWQQVLLEFPLTLPDLALLCIEILEKDHLTTDFGGQVVLPVNCLKEGFRCVPLFDQKGKPLVEMVKDHAVGPRLLCHFQMDKP